MSASLNLYDSYLVDVAVSNFLILHSEQIVPYRGRREGLRQSQVVPIPEFQMGSVVKVPCTLPLLQLDVILFTFSMGFRFFVLCRFIFLILQQPSAQTQSISRVKYSAMK